MNNDKALGLIRHAEEGYRAEIEKNLEVCFDDLHGMVEGIRKNIDQLDGLLERVLYGAPFGGSSYGAGGRLTL